ncbi:MAG: glutaminyl-peptide cyclotransferase [Bacteroidota bacterium]
MEKIGSFMIRKWWFFLLVVCAVFACGDNTEEAETIRSPRVKKNTKIDIPSQNQKITRGTPIAFEISSSGSPIDSVEVVYEGERSVFKNAEFDYAFPSRKVGTQQLLLKVFCGDQSETHFRKIIVYPEKPPELKTYRVVTTMPHDTEDYTQGLLILNGYLYESTGQRGKSTLKKKSLQTGETLQTVNLDDSFFGEGLAVFQDQFYQLTWTSGKALVYNEQLQEVKQFTYETQGWGLVTYESKMLMTDGSEKVYVFDPISFTKESQLEVYSNEGKIEELNELEMIDGLLYANVYQEDFVLVIDPQTGEVLQQIDFSGLLSDKEAQDADVLNGIAVDPESGKIYITGKWWPKLFEVEIIPKLS